MPGSGNGVLGSGNASIGQWDAGVRQCRDLASGSVERRGRCPRWSQGLWNGGEGVPCGVSFWAGGAVDSGQVSHSLATRSSFLSNTLTFSSLIMTKSCFLSSTLTFSSTLTTK
eukprot:2084565-Rhodomonas_salina.1